MKRIVLELDEKETEKLRKIMQEGNDHITVIQAGNILSKETIKTQIKKILLILISTMMAGMIFTIGVWLTASIISLVS